MNKIVISNNYCKNHTKLLYFYAFGHLKLTKNEINLIFILFFKVVRKREFQIITDHINIH